MSRIPKDPDVLDRLKKLEAFQRDAENGTKALRPDPRFLPDPEGGAMGTSDSLTLDIGTAGSGTLWTPGTPFDPGFNVLFLFYNVGVKLLSFEFAPLGSGGMPDPDAVWSEDLTPPDFPTEPAWFIEVRMEGTAYDTWNSMTSDADMIGYVDLEPGPASRKPVAPTFSNDGAGYLTAYISQQQAPDGLEGISFFGGILGFS